MALFPCPECGRQISTHASTCPQCGAPVRLPIAAAPVAESAPASSTSFLRSRLFWLVVIFIVIVIARINAPDMAREKADRLAACNASDSAACYVKALGVDVDVACKIAVTSRLGQDAQWTDDISHPLLDIAAWQDHDQRLILLVGSQVKAPNPLGIPVRREYRCYYSLPQQKITDVDIS